MAGRTGPTGGTGATGATGTTGGVQNTVDESQPLSQEEVVDRAKGSTGGNEVIRHLMMTQEEIDRRNAVNRQHRDGGNDTRARELAERVSAAQAASVNNPDNHTRARQS